MFKITKAVTFTFLFITSVVIAAPGNDEKDRLSDELFELLNISFDAPIEMGIEDALLAQGVVFPEDIEFSFDAIYQEVVAELFKDNPAYRSSVQRYLIETYEEEELRGLINFYKQPLGMKFLSHANQLAEINLNHVLARQEELMFTFVVKIKEQLESAGYDPEEIFEGDFNSMINEGQALEVDLTELENDICSKLNETDKPMPVYREPPVYPLLAQSYGVEGWVDLYFTVRDDGRTEDVVVSNSSAGTLFDDAAIGAVNNYVYCKGKRAEFLQIRITFKLEN